MGLISEADKQREEELLTALREDYLRTLAAMKDHKVHVKLHQNTSISGNFQAIHSNGKPLIITDVEVPMGGLQDAVMLRMPDIIFITFDGKKE